MNNKTLRYVLIIVGILSMLFAALYGESTGALADAAAFPFAQLGALLRFLSLHSTGGNMLAIALYVLVSLLPLLLLLILYLRGLCKGEDALLPLLSAGLFASLYLFVNPGLLGVLNHPAGKAVLGGALYSILIAWAVLKMVRKVQSGKTVALYRLLQALLTCLCIVLAAAAAGGSLASALSELQALHSGNTDHSALFVSYLVLALRAMVNALPYLLDIYVLFALRQLVNALMEKDDAQALLHARSVSRRCAVTLTAVVLSCALFNVLQVLLSAAARQIHVSLMLPLSSMALLLGALLLSRLIGDMKRIREENESFI